MIFQIFLNMTKSKNPLKNLLPFILKKHGIDLLALLGENTALSDFEVVLTRLLLETKSLQSPISSLVFKEVVKGGLLVIAEESFGLEEEVLLENYLTFCIPGPEQINKFYFQKFLYYYKMVFYYLEQLSYYQILEDQLDFVVNYNDFLNQQIVVENLSHVTIRYACNNVFCTFKNLTSNKLIYVTSTGKEKLKASKKNLRVISKILLTKFLDRVKKYFVEPETFKKAVKLVVTLVAPQKSRKFILSILQGIFPIDAKFNAELVLHFKENKCFNGCRPKKQQRKKRKGFRHLR